MDNLVTIHNTKAAVNNPIASLNEIRTTLHNTITSIASPKCSHKEALQDVMKRQAELAAMWFLLLGPSHQLWEFL